MKKIECVIMDWAGTAVDYGCFAPVAAFIDAFASIGVDITADEARAPMGMTKIDQYAHCLRLSVSLGCSATYTDANMVKKMFLSVTQNSSVDCLQHCLTILIL